MAPSLRGRDGMALIVVAAMAVASLVAGLRVGYHEVDVDEVVYRTTLREMRREHLSYYDAMASALVAKEGARPRSVRAIRPPTEFLLLRWFPEGWWRWLAALAGLASLLAVWRLSRFFEPWGAVIGPALAGLWLVGAAPLLFLHAELWGLPWLLAGLVALRRGRDPLAACLFVVATMFRELYGLSVLLALVLRRRSVWVLALAVLVVAGLLHASLAHRVVTQHGHEVRLGNERHDLRFALRLLGPGESTLSAVIGIPALILGFVGAARHRVLTDAPVALLMSLVLLVGAFVATRTYWALSFAPVLMTFVPGAFASTRTSA